MSPLKNWLNLFAVSISATVFPSLKLSKHEIVWKQHATILNRARDNSKRYAVTKAFFALKGRIDMGAFHSTKISGNSGSKSNGTEIFQKFVSKIPVHLSRLSFFSGNLEIPEISCSIWHFYSVWICPSSFSREKLPDGGESFESTLHWMQNDLP